MHAITLTYSLSYPTAMRIGVARSGTDQIDAALVLPHLEESTRAWLGAHPKAVFVLDHSVESAHDLEGDRLARAVAMEVGAAAAADAPSRLRRAVMLELVGRLEAARSGDVVSVHVSLPRRVSDGTNTLSGGLGALTDEDVGPGVLRALERYLDRCVAALRRPFMADVERAPALLRAAYDEGVAAYEDRMVRLALEAAKAGPLPCQWGDSAWARRRVSEGTVGIELVVDVKAPDGRSFRVSDPPSAVRSPRLAGVIEASIAAVERAEAVARERQRAHAACESVLVAIGEAAICSVLDPEQISRRALGALPDGELQQALVDDLVKRLERALGDGYSVGPLDEAIVRWGELPRGGSDVARALDQLACVEEWGDGSALSTGPVVAVRALALDGTEHLLEVIPSA
jgi:hypothetical protein